MRKIYPIDCQSALLPVNCKPITEQQYNDLVEKVGEAKDLANAVSDELEQFVSELATSISTCDITATNVNANDIVADTAQIDSLSATTISSPYLTSDSTNTTVNGDLVVDGRTVANCIIATDTATTNLTATCATICNLITDNFNPEIIDTCVLTVNDITATCVTATEASIDNEVVDSSTITTANIANANITEAEVSCASIQEETVQTSTVDCLDNKYLTHTNEPQHISEPGDIWIVLPKFTNGVYVLEAENDGGTKLFSFEADNSQANLRFKWSVNDNTYLKDVDFIEDVDGVQFLQIHAYTYGQEITLYFHSDSLDNINPPSIYTTKQYEGFKNYAFSTQAGSYLPNAIFVGNLHAESQEIDTVQFSNINVSDSISLTTCKDIYGCSIGYTSGNVNQIITNYEDESGNIYPKWIDPSNTVTLTDERPIMSCAVGNYDGSIQVCDDPLTYCYPITNLADGTVVHGNIEINCGVCNPHLFIGLTCDYNNATLADDAVVVLTDEANPKIYRKSNNTLKELAAQEPDLVDGKPIIYNATNNTLETTNSINIDEAVFDKLTVNEAYIQEAHIVKEEQEVTTSDYLTLRANNDSALTSTEFSGVVVNNYDGSNVTGVVSDCTGTIRVGNGDKTDTTYTDIYYADDKWYSDAELTTEVTVDGTLTAWSSIEETADYTHYTDAVFSKIDWSTTEPLLTRSEATSLTDNALLKWDASGVCATTIAAPTCDESTLAYDATNCCYYWQEKQPGSLIFDTVACYNAYAASTTIPDGTAVYIRCEEDYLMGDDK